MSLAILVLPLALLCLLALFRRRDNWREAALRSLVLFGATVTILTECLGAAGLLGRAPVVAAWSLVALASLAWSARISRRAIADRRRPGLLDGTLLAGITAIVLLVGCIALLSPPNSADALAYHLPRVVYWAQARSVAFFPTPYFNQIMLQPLAEYFQLHTYVLSGGDRFVNLVQFLGFVGSLIGVSLVAQAMGAGLRGQVVAALFCATIPNGILQASGCKNDYLLALWLVAMAWFALRFSQRFERADLAWLSASLGLALLTKGTAYIFAPALLAGVFAPVAWRERARLPRVLPLMALAVLVLNGPQYWRNFIFSGSILGYDSAQGDGKFRWRNEQFGLRPTLSNLLRNLAAHLGARRPAWNQGVYRVVLLAHERIGMDVSDPATTWRGEEFGPPANSNHEANAPNRWQLLLLVAAAAPLGWLAWRGDRRAQALSERPRESLAQRPLETKTWLCYYLGLVFASVLFCFYLKWMPWITRLHLPLFVLGSPIIGVLAERFLPTPLQAALGLFLLNNTRPYVFENWVRPLQGPASVLKTARDDNYFADMKQWNNKQQYLRAVAMTIESGCASVGIDSSEFQLEYPFQALLLERNPSARFAHVGVGNASARYPQRPAIRPCAVLCMNCAGNEEKVRLYRGTGEPVSMGRFLVFLPPTSGPPAARRSLP